MVDMENLRIPFLLSDLCRVIVISSPYLLWITESLKASSQEWFWFHPCSFISNNCVWWGGGRGGEKEREGKEWKKEEEEEDEEEQEEEKEEEGNEELYIAPGHK